jgi:hypothetical protein
MSSQFEAKILSEHRLPARLDAAQTAQFLGFQPHDIPVLVAQGLLEPLGKPVPNAQKFFATCKIEELARDLRWLHKSTQTISKHWQQKNARQRTFAAAPEIMPALASRTA